MAALEAVRASRAAIAAAREAVGLPPVSPQPPVPVAPRVEPAALNRQVSEAFRNLGLGQAAQKVLAESDHIEMTGKQVWGVLSAAGYSLLADKPEQAVSWALRKREAKVGDVILVGDGKWGMVSWYSPARLRELRAARNNASTRNYAEHVEKTKAGIANAKSTRLSQWGRRLAANGEQMAMAYAAIQNGAKSKLAAAKAGGMSGQTFSNYWATYELENWRPGDTFPPPRRAVPKKPSDFKLEDMWPRATFPVSANVTPFPVARGSGGGSM